MTKIHDFFNKQEYLPFSFHLLNEGDCTMLWHKDIEIILVLVGKLNIKVGNKTYILKEQDLFLVNSNESHSFTSLSEDSVVTSLKIDPLFYKDYYPKLLDTYFDCNSSLMDKGNKKYIFIRRSIAKLLSIYYGKSDYYRIHLLKESLTLMEYLISNFKRDYDNAPKTYKKSSHQRLTKIIDFIHNNYTQRISLSDVAKLEYISIYYLSKLFKNHLGIGFHEYISQFRLNKSMKDLITTNKNIIDIALDHGFPNVKSYTKVFKEKYEFTPDEFRKEISSTKTLPPSYSFKPSRYSQEVIQQFISSQEIASPKPLLKSYSINTNSKVYEGEYTGFEKVLYFNLVYDALNTNWQKNLKKIQEEIKFDYIRFSGIFTKGMYFYNSKENLYNWFHIDTLLNFFIENNFKPFIELYFTSKEYTLKKWYVLLTNFLTHCIEKYGLDEVQTWKFELASEDRSYQKSIELYTKTLNIMEKRFKSLKFGILFVPAHNFEDLYFLVNFENQNLDFMSIEMANETFTKKKELVKELLENIRNMNLKTYFINVKKNHYLNDTCFMASNLVNEILNDLRGCNRQITFIDDLMSSKMFYGGLGVLTYNGFKKPTYNAYHLLTMLEGSIIKREQNYLILKKDNKLQILLYNSSQIEDYYELNSRQYRFVKESLQDRTIGIELNLDVDKGKYKFKQYTISNERGCIFNAWFDIGALDVLYEEDFQYLAYKEQTDLSIKTIFIEHSLTIKEFIGSGTIKLIELEKAHG